MSVYVLTAWVPYENDDVLFEGSEEGLREFIHKNTVKKEVPSKYSKKGFIVETKVCGYFPDSLSLSIEGPDIWSYIEK